MGMFDRLYDSQGNEWQTKAFHNLLSDFRLGSPVAGPQGSYQVVVVGGDYDEYIQAYATVIDGILEAVLLERDLSLPLLSYTGAGLTWKANQ